MTLNSIKNALFATIHGMTREEYDLQKAQNELREVTDRFLVEHPEYLATVPAAPQTVSKTTIIKMLGAGADVFKPSDIDPEALERAKAVCRKMVADDPSRYGHIVRHQGV
ncbi:hypothetical protein MUA04_07195 [Enterobacteriaceae bacterium H11S18]|uniref:hypothetical protein n=1 Tax=Dryocola clanedunensis TaxID=2925396 RepID=UPI0022F051BD|nr:hypothetical protein [Dryocola clanedunensis]MCT4709970.1 hypothetical protein [Dryocola clanedunensis]